MASIHADISTTMLTHVRGVSMLYGAVARALFVLYSGADGLVLLALIQPSSTMGSLRRLVTSTMV